MSRETHWRATRGVHVKVMRLNTKTNVTVACGEINIFYSEPDNIKQDETLTQKENK